MVWNPRFAPKRFENGLGAFSGPVVAPLKFGVNPVGCCGKGSLSKFAMDGGYRVSNMFAEFGVMPPVLSMPSVIAAECSGATLASSIGVVVGNADEADEKLCCCCLVA
jgi:hypothetical protein